jgi:putative ABC transport system substrate-binding protein
VNRRRVLALLGLSAAIASPAFAQRSRAARIGWLSYLGEPDPALAMLREGLRELGHAEGTTYVIVPRYGNNDFKRLPALVEELVNERVDLLVSRGPSTEFAKAARNRVPIVFAFSGDPVAAGFADSLRRPGHNMTGITFMAMDLCAKRVEVLKELLPGVKRIALLSNPEHSGELLEYRVTEEAALRFGAEVTRYLIHKPEDIARAFATIREAKDEAILVFPDSLTITRRSEIAVLAAGARIPCMYGWTEFVEAGGLVSYGPSILEGYRLLAVFVDRVLKGGNAGAIPIEQPRKISLTFNMAAVKGLGLKVPPALLARADRLIE